MALYIAGIMFVSIVCTALILNGLFGLIGIIPESGKKITEITQFKIDYTFWMNIAFVFVVGWLAIMNKKFLNEPEAGMMDMEGDGPLKRKIVWLLIAVNIIGIGIWGYMLL